MESALLRFQTFEDFHELIGNRKPVVLLDYDGTITPIVSDPDLAFLPEDMKGLLVNISSKFTTAVVSGRSLSKIKSFVGIDSLYYAGSHGMDIQASNLCRMQVGSEFLPILQTVFEQLSDMLSTISGALVENNVFALSVHYRNVLEGDDVQKILQMIESIMASSPRLRLRHGKKVFEIRPDLSWDKGSAVLWLLQHVIYNDINPRSSNDDVRDHFFPIYIGDDMTDEDAFRALRLGSKCSCSSCSDHDAVSSHGAVSDASFGLGILVSEEPRVSDASFSLQNPLEVQLFLARLLEFGELVNPSKKAGSA